MKQIILASASPRRKELMEKLQIPFVVKPSSYEEVMDENLEPSDLAVTLALGKAQNIAKKHKNAIVIGADSFVVLNDKYLGKPKNIEQAKQMLKQLSGKEHKVVTGMAVIDTETGKTITNATELKIWVKKLTEQEIDAYIATGEPMDKAGAYASQELGSILIEKTEGDFFAGVGLSLFELAKMLKQFGIEVLTYK